MLHSLLKSISGKEVKRLFLIVWPPYGEEDERQIDISVVIVSQIPVLEY